MSRSKHLCSAYMACHCGKNVERDGLHGLSCTKCAGHLSCIAHPNSLVKQTLRTFDSPSMLEPRRLHRTDGKRPDDVPMASWEMRKMLLSEVTVVVALAPCRLNVKWSLGLKSISSVFFTKNSAESCDYST